MHIINRGSLTGSTKMEPTKMEIFNFFDPAKELLLCKRQIKLGYFFRDFFGLLRKTELYGASRYFYSFDKCSAPLDN